MRKDDCDCLNHLNLRLLLYKMFIVVFHYGNQRKLYLHPDYKHLQDQKGCMLLFTTMPYYLHSKKRSGAKLASQ